MEGALEVRRLAPAEDPAAWPVVRQLRGHLTEQECCARLARQRADGYELFGAFAGGELVGVLGMRARETLSSGAHLHVDDLVVADAVRGRGVGRALLEAAERDAAARGLSWLILESRPGAIGFYERLGYERLPAPAMRKALAGAGA